MRRLLILLALLGVAGLGVFWFVTAPKPAVAAGDTSLEQGGDKDKGKLIFFAGGCASCHATPGQEDRLKLGGGYALPSPFGTFYAPNISPHPEDGVGKWTVADMANALIAGVSPDGSHYYPAFPYTTYVNMKLEDVKDLMAFIRSLEPVAGKAKPHELPFPFNIRRTLGGWKFLFFAKGEPAPASATPAVQRGHYLVEALGHCAECHSPRNPLGGIVSAQRYAGGPDPEGKGGWMPNISQNKKGLGDWSAKDIAGFLKTGFNMEGDVVGGTMGSVIKNMAELPESDLLAMGEYLKTLPALESPPRPAKKE